MNRRGFTLIELFIVIAIIAVLAAIAVPNHRSCGRPKRDDPHYCRLRIRTLGFAIEIYQFDKCLQKPPPLSARLLAALQEDGYLTSDPTRREEAGACRYQSVERDPGVIACATHGTLDDIQQRFANQRSRERRVEELRGNLTALGCAVFVLFGVWCVKRSLSRDESPWPAPKVLSSSPRLPRPTTRARSLDETVRFLDAPLPVRDGARCPVCSTALAGEALACASCDTVHHAECFNYNGCCGLYGCGSKRVNRAVCAV